MLSSNTTEELFNSTRRTEERDLYLTEIISDIGEFSHLIDCHGVCGNNNVVSFVANLLVESVFGKKIQLFMCLAVSSSRLLFNKWYEVIYLGNNGKRMIFFKARIIISRINKN